MLNFTSDQWVIVALIFVLGLLVGGFLFSGGGRKWKHRYNAEVARRTDLEKAHAQREKEWREQDSLRAAAARNRPVAAGDPRDVNRDGVVTPVERKPGLMDRVLGRDRADDPRDRPIDPRGNDRDHDGIPNDRDPVDDRKL